MESEKRIVETTDAEVILILHEEVIKTNEKFQHNLAELEKAEAMFEEIVAAIEEEEVEMAKNGYQYGSISIKELKRILRLPVGMCKEAQKIAAEMKENKEE